MDFIDSINFDQLLYLERDSKEYSICKGLNRRINIDVDDCLSQIFPITLFPTSFPRKYYDLAVEIQQEINLIMHKIAYNDDFLFNSLESVLSVDDFTNTLFHIYKDVLRCGRSQSTSLGLFRSDYMIDSEKKKLVQIEVNTIASSFGGLSPILKELHIENLKKCKISFTEKNFCEKNTCSELSKGLLLGLESYGNMNAAILFLVEHQVVNLSDQKQLEFALKKLNPNVNVLRRSFLELQDNLVLNENRLLYVNKIEIGVVYFRTGYAPIHYSEINIKQRTLIEKSKAIKCPSIQHHLAGLKIIQKLLTNKDTLSKFCTSKKNLDQLYSTFANIWTLDSDEKGNQILEEALNNSYNYVLKPQREGGGNNFFGEDLKKILESIRNSKKKNAYILMDLVKHEINKNYIIEPNKFLKNSNFAKSNLISELGIFGVILGDDNNITINYEAGSLLRSKKENTKEVGITAGYGILDTVFLY